MTNTKTRAGRLLHVYGWRLRHWWMDTPGGRVACLAASTALALAAGWLTYRGFTAPAPKPGQPAAAVVWWVYALWMVAISLVMMALAPKPKDVKPAEAQLPQTEDGAGIPMAFGEVWIEGPILAAHKLAGTDNIRGKKSGFSGRPIIGYWYRQIFQFVVCRGPIDWLFEFRGGDKVAWNAGAGGNEAVFIDAENLWGGSKTGGEGGIRGVLDLRFGQPDQEPSAYLASNIGPRQSAHRGLFTCNFQGGRFGAFSPYPKTVAFKLRRILEGWEGGCWYPERAAVPLEPPTALAMYFAVDLSGSMDTITSNGQTRLANMKAALGMILDQVAEVIANGVVVDLMVVGFGTKPTGRTSRSYYAITPAQVESLRTWVNARTTNYWTYFTAGVMDAPAFFGASTAGRKLGFLVTDGEPSTNGSDPQTALSIAQEAAGIAHGIAGASWYGVNIDLADTTYTGIVHNAPGPVQVVDGGDASALAAVVRAAMYTGRQGMNPAHILYQSVTDSWLGDEAPATINDASFRAAANRFYAEGLGLCTLWVPGSESLEQFQQRICDVAGCNLTRSPIDGRWELLPVRADYDLAALPILAEDEILRYEEEPATLDEAVNQVIVEWFDPVAKEDRSTGPVRSLGGIRRAGGVVGEVAAYPEVPYEPLAIRLAARNLNSRSQPQRRIPLRTTPVTRLWMPGQRFRLQVPRRGIADMVCRVGEIDRGTLRSGAVDLVAIQDTFAMRDTSYVQPEPGEGQDTPAPPQPATARVDEMPYPLLAERMTPADLANLGQEDGYLAAMATPAGEEQAYTLELDAGGGWEPETDAGWSASARAAGAHGRNDTVVAVTHLRNMGEVAPGAMVLWDAEVCRLDALDLVGGTLTVARGCADTVAAEHAAGSTLWVVTEDDAVAESRFVDGQSVDARLITRTATEELPSGSAPTIATTLDARQARPFPAGKLKINGAFDLEDANGPLPLSIQWQGRDRLALGPVLVDHEAAGTAEAGTTWQVRGYEDGILMHSAGPLDSPDTTWLPTATSRVRVEVDAYRDGLANWQSQWHELDWASGLPESVMAGNILDKLRHWWPLGSYDDTGFMFTDVHGGADLRVFSGTEAGVINGGAAIRSAGGASTTFTGTAGAGAFLHGKPAWMLTNYDLTSLAWCNLQAGATPNSRCLFMDAPAGDGSQSINSSIQMQIDDATSPYGLRTFWEYNVGLDVTFGPSPDLFAPEAPVFLGFTRLTGAKLASHIVNGVFVDQATYTTDPTGGDSTACKMVVGSRSATAASSTASAGNFSIRGAVQDVMLFNPPLNSDEAAWLYNAGAGRSYQDLWDIAELARPWTPAAVSRKVLWIQSDSSQNREASPGYIDSVANLAGFMPGATYGGSSVNRFRNDLATLNGRKVLTGDAAGGYQGHFVFPNTNFGRFNSVDGLTMVMVHRADPAQSSNATYVAATSTGSNLALMGLAAVAPFTGYSIGGRRLSGDSYAFGVQDATPRGWAIVIAMNDYSDGTSKLKIDGGEVQALATYTTGTTASGNPSQPLALGGAAYTADNRPIHSDYAEVLVFDKRLSLTEMQKLEGYLAHRWGLAANLPAGHPYKAAPPTL